MALKLDVHRDTLTNWANAHPDFAAALDLAVSFARGYWEELADYGARQGKNYNATMYIFTLKNRWPADYREKHEVEHKGGNPFLAFLAAIDAGKVPLPPNPHKGLDSQEGEQSR
jgi:hypothetical protein